MQSSPASCLFLPPKTSVIKSHFHFVIGLDLQFIPYYYGAVYCCKLNYMNRWRSACTVGLHMIIIFVMKLIAD
jgi:hypothetical protein